MSHNHTLENCYDEGHSHGHHHDIPEAQGHRDNLFSHIDRDNVVALNVQSPGKGPEVIKPWHERQDETAVCIPTLDTALYFVGLQFDYPIPVSRVRRR